MPIPCCFDYCSFPVSVKIRKYESSLYPSISNLFLLEFLEIAYEFQDGFFYLTSFALCLCYFCVPCLSLPFHLSFKTFKIQLNSHLTISTEIDLSILCTPTSLISCITHSRQHLTLLTIPYPLILNFTVMQSKIGLSVSLSCNTMCFFPSKGLIMINS